MRLVQRRMSWVIVIHIGAVICINVVIGDGKSAGRLGLGGMISRVSSTFSRKAPMVSLTPFKEKKGGIQEKALQLVNLRTDRVRITDIGVVMCGGKSLGRLGSVGTIIRVLGTPSKGGHNGTIDIIQRKKGGHPRKSLEPVLGKMDWVVVTNIKVVIYDSNFAKRLGLENTIAAEVSHLSFQRAPMVS